MVWYRRVGARSSTNAKARRDAAPNRLAETRQPHTEPPERYSDHVLRRMPDGLPSWFLQKDANSDGQIQMSEFAEAWTKERADEFVRLDLNGDLERGPPPDRPTAAERPRPTPHSVDGVGDSPGADGP
jgi:hypothetical protein